MSAILSQIAPWIAATVFQSMMFDPDQNPKINRKTRIVQVFSSPQVVELSVNCPRRSYYQIVVSDGRNHIPVYIPNDSSNAQKSAIQGELERIRQGSLVTLKHLQISTHNLLGVDTKTNFNKPMCLVVHPVKMNAECILYQDEATIHDISLECIGCENAGIIGNPVDIHDDIDIRRALIVFQYNHRMIAKQVIDCFNYIVWGHSFEEHGGKLLPGWSQSEIGTFVSVESMKQVASIINHYKNHIQDYMHVNGDEKSVHHGPEEKANSISNHDEKDSVNAFRHRDMIPSIASIGQVLASSYSDDSDDDDIERMETQNPDMYSYHQDTVSYAGINQPNLHRDATDDIRNSPSENAVDFDNGPQSDDINLEENLNQHSNFIETQDAVKVMESNIEDKVIQSDQEESQDEDGIETQMELFNRDGCVQHRQDPTRLSNADEMLETQPAPRWSTKAVNKDEDFYSAQSDMSENSDVEIHVENLVRREKNILQKGVVVDHTVTSASSLSQKKRVVSVSAWLRDKKDVDSSQSVAAEIFDQEKPEAKKQVEALLKPSELGKSRKKRIISVSAWMKRKEKNVPKQSQDEDSGSNSFNTKKRKVFSVIKWKSNRHTDDEIDLM